MRIDMHIHTTASDGTWSPEVLIKNILSAGIDVFSVTDHDSVESVLLTSNLANKADLKLIPGVEINTSHQNTTFHILGYSIDIENEVLKNLLSINRRFTDERDEESIYLLMGKGYPVSIEEYNIYENKIERGGWKALNYCIDKGICKNNIDFAHKFDNFKYRFDRVNYVSSINAMSSIKQAGGIPILAHPGARIYGSNHENIVEMMFELGIEGIECYHPENSAETTRFCIEFCRSNNLLITGGSDCHGDFVKERKLGKPELRLDQLEIEKIIK